MSRMSNENIVIARLEERATGKIHPIEWWGEYGVVAPTLVVTNGNAGGFARWWWSVREQYRVITSVLPDLAWESGPEALQAALVARRKDRMVMS